MLVSAIILFSHLVTFIRYIVEPIRLGSSALIERNADDNFVQTITRLLHFILQNMFDILHYM